jgi:hypothetical protein
MERVILTLGQAALLLASVVAVLGITYVAVWLAAGIVRKVRELANPHRSRATVYRVGGDGGDGWRRARLGPEVVTERAPEAISANG